MPKYQSILDVKEILNEYSQDVQEGIEEEGQSVAKEIVKELKNHEGTYKIRTGKYNKGWRINTKAGRGYFNHTVWNATDWQLTHLLENGHATRNGGKTRAFEHIKPIEKKYVKQFENDVENIIKNGG